MPLPRLPRVSRRGFLLSSAAMAASPFARAAEAPPLPPDGKLSIVLDTDAYNEIDDQFAIAYALLSPDRIETQAIYAAPFLNSRSRSAGEGMEKSYEEVYRIYERLGDVPKPPVFRGSERFIGDTDKPVKSAAAQDLIERANRSSGKLWVVAVGAPTNVASALMLEPGLKEKITVVWLGGQPHQFPSATEFNLKQDVAASQTLFDSGVALVQIPTVNVSEQLRTTIPEMERFLKGRSRISDYLLKIFVDYYAEHGYPLDAPRSKVIWDISALAWLINPRWVPSRTTPAPKLTDDMRWELDDNRHPMRVATRVNRDAVFGDLFAKLVGA